MRDPGSRLRYAVWVALLAAAYVLTGRLGFTASAIHPVVSSAWPPSGLALAALLLLGMRFWPAITIGAFAVNLTGGIAPLAAAGIAVGNTLEALTAVWLLTTLAEFRPSLERLRDVLALLLAAIMSAPVSATVGVAALTLSGASDGISQWTIWLAWCAGDVVGILLVTPLVLTWIAGHPQRITGRDAIEAIVLAILLIASTVVLFLAHSNHVYTIFPVIIWAALRFRPRGAATASFIVAVLAIGYTVVGVGPFAKSAPVTNLFELETFIGLLALTTLILAAVFAERQAAESALQRSRRQHRDLVHYASVGVYQTDPDGRILLANPALASILGYDRPEDLIGRKLADEVYPEGTGAGALDPGHEALAEGSAQEVQWQRKDGSQIWVDLHTRSVRDAAGIASSEGFVYDVTVRKQMERQLGQAQKMEAIGQLAGGVAHDFNNILTVIGSCTDFILDDKALPDQHRADLADVKKAADRATSLTRQLLAFGRTQVLRPSTISLNDRLAELHPMLRRLFETTIDIRLEMAPDLWPVRADPGQIEQVLLNLALNSRDAMPEGGALTFATENRVVAGERTGLDRKYITEPGDYVVLSVRDTGAGMDEETQGRIFEPFFTTKKIGKGTGLGLATAYGIVKQSGGYIKVRSAPGKGAEFLIYLPRTDVAPEEVVARADRNGGPASGTVLLAEDEPVVRQSLQRILAAEGYDVLGAANGAEALELFAERKDEIDLLITDLVMPGMGGRELAQECRGLRDTLKVIYISGYTRDSLLSQQTFEEGTEFIEKPFTRDAILGRIAYVLRS
ncbi:MAG: MASE1 domain-containing protein [Gemmatimonadaceae bacterium]